MVRVGVDHVKVVEKLATALQGTRECVFRQNPKRGPWGTIVAENKDELIRAHRGYAVAVNRDH